MRARITVNCPRCGTWFRREGTIADSDVMGDYGAYLLEHAGHCTCDGTQHDPHASIDPIVAVHA